MLLLVIGLVAVIIAVLVAAFLSMRRGRDDEEDEPGGRLSVRDRMRGRGHDGHGQEDHGRQQHEDAGGWGEPTGLRGSQSLAGRGAAASRRPAPDRRGSGGAERFGPSGYDQDRGYEPSPRGYGERRPGRGYDRPRRESTEPVRGGAADLEATQVSLPRAAGARAGTAARRAGSGVGATPAPAP